MGKITPIVLVKFTCIPKNLPKRDACDWIFCVEFVRKINRERT